MAKILSRSTLVGSLGVVTDGDSTSSYGTLPSSGDGIAWYHAAEVSLAVEVGSTLVDTLAGPGSGGEGPRYVTSKRVTGTIRIPATRDDMGAVLLWAFGASSTSGASDPYSHTFAVSIARPFRSVYFVYSDTAGNDYQDEYYGLQVESATLAIDAQGVGYITLQVSGGVATRTGTDQLGVSATETPAAPSLLDSDVMLGRYGAAMVFNSNAFEARSVEMALTFPMDRATAFGAVGPDEGVLSGGISATIQATRTADTADSATLRAAHSAGTRGAFSMAFTWGTNRTWTLALSTASITAFSAPFSPGGALVETLTMTAQSLTSSDYHARVVVVNGDASAVTTGGATVA